MKFGIIIPAHNEAEFIQKTLDSLLRQTYLPHKIVVVDDNSTDETPKIVQKYAEENPIITYIKKESSENHLPGGKVVQTFNAGLSSLGEVDIICKFDADLIFPKNYLEKVKNHYETNPQIGMCGGFCYIQKGNDWVLENLTNKEHLRGPIKSYRKACFEAIGGLKTAMGWDTADELLARYNNWIVKTDKSLKVKHLRPTGAGYSSKAHQMQGQMFYAMRYDCLLGLLAMGKHAYKKKSFRLFREYWKGFRKAKKEKIPYLVTEKEGKWIRNYRWNGIFSKIFNKK